MCKDFIVSSEVTVYPKLIKMIFSHVKGYGIYTSEKQHGRVIFTLRFRLLLLISLFP